MLKRIIDEIKFEIWFRLKVMPKLKDVKIIEKGVDNLSQKL